MWRIKTYRTFKRKPKGGWITIDCSFKTIQEAIDWGEWNYKGMPVKWVVSYELDPPEKCDTHLIPLNPEGSCSRCQK